MPSFDIVSEVELHEVRNAVENAQREVTSRWDFRNITATIELNEKNNSVKMTSESDFQVNQLVDIMREKLAKRGIDGASLTVPDEIVHSGKLYSVEATLLQGDRCCTGEKDRQADQRQQTESAGANPGRRSPGDRQIP
ncbi:putative nucleotide-binding protein [Morganella morganii]|nr:putative nucleotide-binding protein [Morganella morganii]